MHILGHFFLKNAECLVVVGGGGGCATSFEVIFNTGT